MKVYFMVIMVWVLESCGNYEFKELPCSNEVYQYSVFKPCREHIFQVKYWDQRFNLISEEKIWMMATGEPWGPDEEQQREIIFQYEYEEEKISTLEKYSLNKEYGNWGNMESTGVIETKDRIWMHPFRKNQYTFTEVVPFPQVVLPLEIGKKWSGTLNIHDWGVWSDTKVSSQFEITSYEKVTLPLGELDTWRIDSYADTRFGRSTQTLWFHAELGFVKVVIRNYVGQTLEVVLAETTDG